MIRRLRQTMTRAASALVAAALAAGQAVAGDAAVSGSIELTSDSQFRGVSQTWHRPALQGTVQVALEGGTYAYAWGSNVDFGPDDDATIELNLAVGHSLAVTDDIAVDFSVVRYVYPGTAVDGDYDELLASVYWRENAWLTVGYSADVFASDGDSWLLEAGASKEIGFDAYATLTLGHFDLSRAYGERYSYFIAGVTRAIGRAEIDLQYHDTAGADEALFGTGPLGPQVVVTLRLNF